MMEKLVSITVIVMQAQQMYNGLLQTLKEEYAADKIFDGEFGAMMDVSLVNDGPVTWALPPILALLENLIRTFPVITTITLVNYVLH